MSWLNNYLAVRKLIGNSSDKLFKGVVSEFPDVLELHEKIDTLSFQPAAGYYSLALNHKNWNT